MGFDFWGDFPCGVASCGCRFANVVDWAMHSKRGRHDVLGGGSAFEGVRAGYYVSQRFKERMYREKSRQSVLQ